MSTGGTSPSKTLSMKQMEQLSTRQSNLTRKSKSEERKHQRMCVAHTACLPALPALP